MQAQPFALPDPTFNPGDRRIPARKFLCISEETPNIFGARMDIQFNLARDGKSVVSLCDLWFFHAHCFCVCG